MDPPARLAFSRSQLRVILREILTPNTETTPGDLLSAIYDVVETQLAAGLDPGARVARITFLLRECRRASAQSSSELRDLTCFALVSATYKRPSWMQAFVQAWNPKHRLYLSGSYQFALRVAKTALRLHQAQSFLEAAAPKTRVQALLELARAALHYAEYGFTQAGPQVRGVRLSSSFARKLFKVTRFLVARSGAAQDNQHMKRVEHLTRHLLQEDDLRRTRRARTKNPQEPSLSFQPWFSTSKPVRRLLH